MLCIPALSLAAFSSASRVAIHKVRCERTPANTRGVGGNRQKGGLSPGQDGRPLLGLRASTAAAVPTAPELHTEPLAPRPAMPPGQTAHHRRVLQQGGRHGAEVFQPIAFLPRVQKSFRHFTSDLCPDTGGQRRSAFEENFQGELEHSSEGQLRGSAGLSRGPTARSRSRAEPKNRAAMEARDPNAPNKINGLILFDPVAAVEVGKRLRVNAKSACWGQNVAAGQSVSALDKNVGYR